MIPQRQGVDQRNFRPFGHLVEVFLVALRADDDEVVHLGEYAHGVPNGLAIAHVGVGEVGESHTQIVARGFERAARARGAPFEVGDNVLAWEIMLIDASLFLRFEGCGKIDQITKLLFGEVAQVQDVATEQVMVHGSMPF